VGYRFGLEPPNIIKLEREIETEEPLPEPPPLDKPVVFEDQKPVVAKEKPPPVNTGRPLNLDEEVGGAVVRGFSVTSELDWAFRRQCQLLVVNEGFLSDDVLGLFCIVI